MKLNRLAVITLALILAAVLSGCAAKGPTLDTTPPQVRIMQMDRAVADAINVAAKLTAQLSADGKLSPTVAGKLRTALIISAKTSDAIADELQSDHPWPQQRSNIAVIVANTGLDAAQVTDPALRAQVLAIIQTFEQILTAVRQ